jgi:hypothetical protein
MWKCWLGLLFGGSTALRGLPKMGTMKPRPKWQWRLWVLGISLTGAWVIVLCGFLVLSGYLNPGSPLFYMVAIGCPAWVLSLLFGLLWRTRVGLWIATVPLVVTAGIALYPLVSWLLGRAGLYA